VSNLSWAPALIFEMGILLVSFGVIGFLIDQIHKARQYRMESHRSFSIMQDLKDLNS
jgi:hypothetical protein